MTAELLFSDASTPLMWSEIGSARLIYGPKGAGLAALPRPWTPPFVLVPAAMVRQGASGCLDQEAVGPGFLEKVSQLAGEDQKVIMRSSVIGESIWDRGSYESIVLSADLVGLEGRLSEASQKIIHSAPGKEMALVIQRFVEPRDRGEFGNLLRISKTRDHWELSSHGPNGQIRTIKFNTQRDRAASHHQPLLVRAGVARERLFASIAAWINNDLVRGTSIRLNCEWVTDNRNFYVVQVDEEDEDFQGVNPFQLPTTPAHRPASGKGHFLCGASPDSLPTWDKLKVLEELWEEDVEHKPNLFFVTIASVLSAMADGRVGDLAEDFRALIGSDNIVVRTSIRVGEVKQTNLPRTDCLTPVEAAEWCVAEAKSFANAGADINSLAFVAHRYIDAVSSAWTRADPNDPIVEIHSLWGLPDGLQYCAYDIWEVHVPTDAVTEYTEYKAHALIPQDNGAWKFVRIKNEIARSASIRRPDAVDIARRAFQIAKKLGRPCHIMWFVECIDDKGATFNLPWYWTEAHESEKNTERWTHKTFLVDSREALKKFSELKPQKDRLAIDLRPGDPELMRDNEFIAEVSRVAQDAKVPVIIEGSTLAHAYYQLRRNGCTVVAQGGKDHTRIRRSSTLGKLVRDKIPEKIAARKEAGFTTSIPPTAKKAFLLAKLLEEALEVRESKSQAECLSELADLFEVFRALVGTSGHGMDDVVQTADIKRAKVGGFDDGLVLLQTGILGRGQFGHHDSERPSTQVLARRIDRETYEIPFTFFGFLGIEEPRTITFDEFGVSLEITLKPDRIELRMAREPEQLELVLDGTISPPEK